MYDKHTSQIIGFVNLGDQQSAVGLWVVYEAGISICSIPLFFNFRRCHLSAGMRQQNACSTIFHNIFAQVWKCIQRLENCGFMVIALTADGASCNRKFFKMHGSSGVYVQGNKFILK